MKHHSKNNITKLFLNIVVIGFLFSISSCCPKPIPDPEIDRSLLIYLAADNDLSRESFMNIEAMKQGFIPRNGNIIVYHDPVNATPRLFRLVQKGTIVEEELIEQYPEENSADPATLTRCLERMRDLFPAKEYALILWSHANGWFPNGTGTIGDGLLPKMDYALPDTIEYPKVKTFGVDGTRRMELEELVTALPYHLSFILFDACSMGSAEVAYTLRDKADYLIASPAEVLGDGFPYHQIMQPIFLPKSDLEEVCNLFFRFYNEHSDERYRSATVALYHLKQMQELTNSLRSIFALHRAELNVFLPNSVQRYGNSLLYSDLDDFVNQLASPAEYELFKKSLDKVVSYKRATKSILSLIYFRGYFPIERYGGISCYIPSIGSQTVTNEAFRKSEWNRAVGLME